MPNRIGMRWRELARDRWALGGWVVLGLGLLLLAVSIPFSIWLIQRSGDAGTISAPTAASGSPRDIASFGDSAKLEIRRGSGEIETATVGSGQTGLTSVGDDDDSGQELSAGDSATFSDAVTFEVGSDPEADPDETAPVGGAGGATSLTDSAEIVVRDSEGNIKEQGVVK